MAPVIDQRRMRTVDDAFGLYVPEVSPVIESPRLPVMTRPWLDWARRVTAAIRKGATGDVSGPSGATADALALFDGTTGKFIKDSLKTIAALTTDIINAILPGGTLPDANLSANVALRNAANTFTADQKISSSVPIWRLYDTSQPVNSRLFRIVNVGQELHIQAVDDGESAVAGQIWMTRTGRFGSYGLGSYNASIALDAQSSTGVTELRISDNTAPANNRMVRVMAYVNNAHIWTADDLGNPQGMLQLDRNGHLFINGNFYEANRLVAQGVWIDVPYDPANFTSSGATWTVGPGSQLMFKYMLIGKTMFVAWTLLNTTVTGAFAELLIQVPGGYSARATGTVNEMGIVKVFGSYEEYAGAYINAISNKISLQRQSAGVGWGTGTFTLRGEIFFEIQ